MYREIISKVIKLCCIIFTIFLLINFSKVYANENFETRLERNYDKVEIDGEVFYKMKEWRNPENIHISFESTGEAQKEENTEIVNIINKRTKEYFNQFTFEDCPVEKRIQEGFDLSTYDIYSINDEKTYKEGDDIEALVRIYAKPVQGDSDYWKENFTKNELYYDEYDKEYSVTMYYFVRLSINSESNEYEIAYIGLEPENYEEKLKELKEQGIDLENLDIDKIINTKYTDDIKVVPSTETLAISAEKEEYNSEQIKEIKNISFIIKIVSILIILVMAIIVFIRFHKKKMNNI